MTLWAVLTVMITVAALFAAAPFIRRRERKRLAAENQLSVYLDQLKEVDVDEAQGALNAMQASSARTEIKRRMIAAGLEDEANLSPLSGGERTFAAVTVTGIVVLGSAILFSVTADFGPPPPDTIRQTAASDASFLERLWGSESSAPRTSTDAPVKVPVKTAAKPAQAAGKTPLPPVDELVQRLVTRLQRNPKDPEGWRMLGWSYFSMERFSEAAAAYARAIELNPDAIEFREGHIEALLRAADGRVTGDVTTEIEDTLKRAPKNPRALFVQGLSMEQAGDRAGAERAWGALLKDLSPSDPWAKEIAKKMAGQTPAPAPTATTATSRETAAAPQMNAEFRGPTAEDVSAASAMAPSDRMAMIRGMVDKLASRLETSPRDADSWIRLIRSWAVLGENSKAVQALDRALGIFADDPGEARRITDAAATSAIRR